MRFASLLFFVFVAGVWLLHRLTPAKFRWVILLVASIAFYCLNDIRGGIWLVLCTLITFFGAKLVSKQKERRPKRIILAAVLISMFGLLFIFKFAGFAARLLPQVFGPLSGGLLLPLGISYFIFQSAGYVIDIYRGKYEPESNIARYGLFVSFFPQIIQGPIGRYDRLAPGLFSGEKPGVDSYRHGIQLIIWGLFKKMILADRVGVLVATVFSSPESHGGIVTAIAAAFYCVQMYCEFSGGIDISRGIAEGFGVRLDKNFEQPLFATSVSDFWRRWHITLGSWMRDYLFYPLSLSRLFGKFGKRMRKVFGVRIGKLIPSLTATFIVFFVIGVWHGGQWKYIGFGLWNGTLITAAMFMEPYFAKMRQALKIKENSKLFHTFRILRTLIIVGLGRILTRANNVTAALIMVKHIFTSPKSSHILNGALMQLGLTGTDYIIIAVSFLVLLTADIMEENNLRVREFIARRHAVLQVIFLAVSLISVVFFGVYRSGYVPAQFLYAGF